MVKIYLQTNHLQFEKNTNNCNAKLFSPNKNKLMVARTKPAQNRRTKRILIGDTTHTRLMALSAT